jgi:polyisoprenoid-binding protein YceI
MNWTRLALCAVAIAAGGASADEVHYTIDPSHTYPSFSAPHIQGISIWRGKLTKTSGSIRLDRAAKSGTVHVSMDTASIEFGHAMLDEHVRGEQFLDAARYPVIAYDGRITGFAGDVPAEVAGDLTMHGVTRPVSLKVESFKCIEHPMFHREVCGAELSGELDRAVFGVDYGVQMTGSPMVKLQIQVEAIQGDTLPAMPPPASKPASH